MFNAFKAKFHRFNVKETEKYFFPHIQDAPSVSPVQESEPELIDVALDGGGVGAVHNVALLRDELKR